MKSFRNKIPACLVHFLTGSGIIFSFLALISVMEGNKTQAFMFLGIALKLTSLMEPWLESITLK